MRILFAVGFLSALAAVSTPSLLRTVGAASPELVRLDSAAVAAPPSPLTASPAPGLTLGLSAIPSAICVNDSIACDAAVGRARVTITASAPVYNASEWPPVQVAFVLETTPYDGVYDPTGGITPTPGLDPCANQDRGSSPLCEESNGVPFFVHHAQDIANAISAANPKTNVTFAMVDYFATLDQYDDGDGQEYHVDIPYFIPASDFGPSVANTFQRSQLQGGGGTRPSGYIYGDSDMSDNFLHSSSITALYGTIIGSGLDWSPAAHHVIVWIGSTAPRDSAYPVDYTVSPSGGYPGTPYGCEPSYRFGDLVSPSCEGWVRSQDGYRADSIAQLARSASTCTQSIGKVCTIDVIDLYDTPTDPQSPGWPCSASLKSYGGCPGGWDVVANTQSILNAGCDLAAATGGTWSGPSYFLCPNGTAGTLRLETIGPDPWHPNVDNPDLMAAFQGIGFGPQLNPLVANGTAEPMFQFVPYAAFRIDPSTTFSSNCSRAVPPERWPCDPRPIVISGYGAPVYGWNWSDDPAENRMYMGDVWSVSFYVYAAGPPFGWVPVDACATPRCHLEGEVIQDGQFTWAEYRATVNRTVVRYSFPLELLAVLPISPAVPPPSPPPPPVPNLPPVSIPVSGAVATGVPAPSAVASAAVALQTILAGALAAGFTRVSVRTRSVAIAQAQRVGRRRRTSSIFESDPLRERPPVGRFD